MTTNFNGKTPLDQQAANILSINPTRHRTYESIIKHYQTLAHDNQWQNEDGSIWPISKASLIKFIRSICSVVTPPTITSYLSALKFYHTRNSVDWSPVRFDPLIKELLKTIEANQKHEPIKQKMHITRTHLEQIRRSLDFSITEDLLFWAVALTAFYGLARLSELLPNYEPDGGKVLTLKALRFEKA